METKNLDRFKGCLFGCAIGDAFGYAVEFLNIEQIRELYGRDGITSLQLVDGKALVSDDTQMTLFTANGILVGMTAKRLRGEAPAMERCLHNAYMDWHRTQRLISRNPDDVTCWLYQVKEMHSVRAPGGTCLRALTSGVMGTPEHPINSSKGCGGLMRVTPIGLYFDPARYDPTKSDELGARSAALTHGHPLGYLPAAVLTRIIRDAVYGDYPGSEPLYDIADDAIAGLMAEFGEACPKAAVLRDLLQRAVELAKAGGDDLTNVSMLGEGWVAEEALSISLYCALRYQNDLQKALIASVNHSGDSDSTGAITGIILGALRGNNAIPTSHVDKLELKNVIRTIAEDLYTDCAAENADHCRTDVWQRKYVKADYRM